MPCLTATALAKNLSVQVMMDAWPLMVWSVFHQLVGVLVAFLAMKAVGFDRKLFPVFASACVYGNAGTLPLIIAETLSRIPPFSHKTDSLDVMTT